MTNQAWAVPWVPAARSEPRRRLPSIAFAVSIAAFFIVGTAEAKQQCSAAAGSQRYWSWRMIDGKKCWYEGKPMLSKAMLEWPTRTVAQPKAKAEAASAAVETDGDPMDAQAYAPRDAATFETLWRDRIEGSRK
jgi:hypothetical protein